MKTYWKMPIGLKVVFDKEIQESTILFRQNEFFLAWQKLERAHIIGQPWAVEHTISHWKMLLFAFKIKNTKEIIGQLPRLFIGGIKSYVGKVPTGNTGGSNVHPLKKMEISDDILQIMNPYYKAS
jgi:Protein of unknown function (DUF3703)